MRLKAKIPPGEPIRTTHKAAHLNGTRKRSTTGINVEKCPSQKQTMPTGRALNIGPGRSLPISSEVWRACQSGGYESDHSAYCQTQCINCMGSRSGAIRRNIGRIPRRARRVQHTPLLKHGRACSFTEAGESLCVPAGSVASQRDVQYAAPTTPKNGSKGHGHLKGERRNRHGRLLCGSSRSLQSRR